MKMWRLLIQAIGATAIILSVWGFYWLVDLIPRGLKLSNTSLTSGGPYFRTTFLAMNAIDAVFLAAMIVIAVGLLRYRRLAVRAYTALSVCLLIYTYAPGLFWSPGPVGTSIAMATGVGLVALAPLVHYPVKFVYLVSTVTLANLAMWRLEREPTANTAN